MERPDALNSAVEGERDLGMSLMWGSSAARQRFRDLTAQGLKGSGDYGVAAVGVYSGQGLNRPDQNADVHVLGRLSYPFKTAGGRFFELGVQGYIGRFVTTTQAITSGGETFTPTQPESGVADQRLAVTAIAYPQPLGVEAEWNFGEGPELSEDLRSIGAKSLHGGYVQANYQLQQSRRHLVPVRPLELLRRRPQVRPQRAARPGQRAGLRGRVRPLGRRGDHRHLHPHLPPDPHQRLPVRRHHQRQSRRVPGAVELVLDRARGWQASELPA